MDNHFYNKYSLQYNNSINIQQVPRNNNNPQWILPHMNFMFNGNLIEDQNNSQTEDNLFEEQMNNKKISPKSTIEEGDYEKRRKDEKENINKDNYIYLLINSINNLIENGEINLEYINNVKASNFDSIKFSLALNNLSEDKENYFSKKCDNKICTFLADHPHKLFKAKFFGCTSHKPKNIYLCEKCYKAYKAGSYCYYCNTVYREYEQGTQYYDKKKWIQCYYCHKWQHMQCEEKKGKYENIEELTLNANFKYMCPFCRKEHECLMRQKHKDEKIRKNSLLSNKRKGSSLDEISEKNKFKNKK